jgi:hypothetical protein
MKSDQEFDRIFRQEFSNITSNLLWQNDAGEYEVFGKYRIIPARPGYQVYCSATDIGIFNSTRSALSWCIADKFNAYNTAREILTLDQHLGALTRDIATGTSVGERSKNWEFRDTIGTKLETKIIRKKQVENELTKCVNWAKYIQQRGFENETARTGRNQPIKASR